MFVFLLYSLIIMIVATKDQCDIHKKFSISSDKRVCILFLTNEGPQTLQNTINTYKKSGFLGSNYTREFFMFMNADKNEPYDQLRRKIAAENQMKVLSVKENIVFGSIGHVINLCQSDFFLFLEEDFIVNPKVNFEKELLAAMDVLDRGVAQGVRLRHRHEPGPPDYACDSLAPKKRRTYDYLRYPIPDCAHRYGIDDTGGNCFLWKCSSSLSCYNSLQYNDMWRATTYKAKITHFTNNPMLYHTAWYRRQIYEGFVKRGVDQVNTDPNSTSYNRSMETMIMQSPLWSKPPGVTLAKGTGIFTHRRIDRGRGWVRPSIAPRQ